MGQLLFPVEPGIFALMSDAIFAGGQYATDEDFIKINSNTQFGVVRKELINMGYYNAGSSPPAPASPVDAADINGDEIVMIPVYITEASVDSAFIPGQVNFPGTLPYTHGHPLIVPYQHYFDQDNGSIVDSFYAFDTSNVNSQVFQWGASLVFALCLRLGVFTQTSTAATSGSGSGGSSGTGGGAGGGGGTPGTIAGSIVSPTATVTLTPANAGNFTVAHGLGVAPKVIGALRMTSDGAMWWQNPKADATNLYLTASAGGITGEVDLWT